MKNAVLRHLFPEWIEKNCIQCNQCSYICPHACIRPFLLNEKEQALAPKNFESKAAAGKELAGHTFRIQVSPLDCTGCGNCADICPAKEKALVMQPAAKQIKEQADNWAFAVSAVADKPELMTKETVKGSQFARPLMEFSGACGGCGETPYMKLVTQLFGERMVIANADRLFLNLECFRTVHGIYVQCQRKRSCVGKFPV